MASRAAGTASAAPAHPLTFRVMRLTAATPSKRPSLPFSCATAAACGASDALLRGAPACEGEGAAACVGSVCVLPASFGSIYAAETFRSFISAYNLSGEAVHAVSVAIEIQTAAQRRIALVSTRSPSNLAARDAQAYVVSAPLPELGVHVLSCTATYVDRGGAPRTLRQLFRFNVLPPLETFVNVIPLHSRRLGGEGEPRSPQAKADGRAMAQFLVDLRIINTMPVPVYITAVKLNAEPMYTIVRPLIRPDDSAAERPKGENVEGAEGAEGSEGTEDGQATAAVGEHMPDLEEDGLPVRSASMGVGDTRNFLFFVAREMQVEERPSKPTGNKPSGQESPAGVGLAGDPLGATTIASPMSARPARSGRREIGTFSLQWHSASGEKGRMDELVSAFEPAVRSAEIEVHIAAVPHDIQVQIPFAARCVARNNTSNAVRLYLQVRRDLVGEIVPVGMSGVSLGEVAPESSSECLLSLIALSRGQHSISGVRVVDIDSRQSYSAEAPLVSVL